MRDDKKGGVTSEFSLTIQQTGVSGRSKKLDVECNSDLTSSVFLSFLFFFV